jgi:phosphohistidine phosphatase SixA
MLSRRTLAVVILAVISTSAVAADGVSDDIVPLLQKGGCVLYIRHPKTNEDQADVDPLHLDNIQAQRQLTDDGREQARQLGALLRSLGIPVASVISSKFYRAQEAAKLLGLGDVTTSTDVTEGGLVVSPKENKRRAAALQKLLATPPPAGKNVVIVSHKPNLQDAAGKDFGDMAEAEIAVFQSTDDGKFRCVGRYTADVWSTWKQKP